MIIFQLILLETLFLAFAYIYFRKWGAGLVVLTSVITFIFVFISFLVTFLHFSEVIDWNELGGRELYAKYTAEFGSDSYVLLVYVLFQILFIVSSIITRLVMPRVPDNKTEIPQLPCERKADVLVLLILSILIVIYLVSRFVFIDDFPLVQLIKYDGNAEDLRSLGFRYASNTEPLLIYNHSIFQATYRVMLPFVAISLYFYATPEKVIHYKELKVYSLVLLSVSFIMMLGTFKRMPLIYLTLWLIVFFNYYSSTFKSFRKYYKYLIAAIGIVIVITYSYSGDAKTAIAQLFNRLFVIEGISEYLALRNFGENFEHLGWTYFDWFYQKAIGENVLTFSEWWKAVTTEEYTRGYSSIGFFTEFYVISGYYGVVYIIMIGLIFGVLDNIFKGAKNGTTRVFLSGLIVVYAFSSIKGIVSQTLAGGGLMLFFTYIIYRLMYRGVVNVCR